MRTKNLTLIYSLTQKEIIPPSPKELERKDKWLKGVQAMVEADYKPLLVKVRYEMFDPEMEQQRKFFEGACVLYYAVQDLDMLEGEPDNVTLDKYRERLLDALLGYDYKTTNKISRLLTESKHTRVSTTDFKTVQAWNTFLQTLEETEFDSQGYEFPDSKLFWELVKQHGHDQAREISVKKLQERMKKRV